MSKEIGIDLGTTNTIITYKNKKDKLKQLRYEGDTIIPSVIYFKSQKEFEIGYKAKDMMKHNHQASVENFKTMLDLDDKIEIIAENGDVFKITPKEIVKLFLNRIILKIEETLLKEFGTEGTIGNVVITVPAKFNDREKATIKKSAIRANFKNVKLALEPTAAAVAYQNSTGSEGKTILVYDLGGGTFDVSVVREENNKFIELATGGDKTLGGSKFTSLLAEDLLKKIEKEYSINLPFDKSDFDEDDEEISFENYQSIRNSAIQEAEDIKKELSTEDEMESYLHVAISNDDVRVFDYEFSREDFENVIYEDINKTMIIVDNVIKEYKSKYNEEIDEIVLAGGSSQIPMIMDIFNENYKRGIVVFADNVSTLISRGASILATRELEEATQSITNVQYGVTTSQGINRGIFNPLIHENQKLPFSAKEKFYLSKDNQTRIEIRYFEKDVKNYPDAKRIDQDGINLIDTIVVEGLPENLQQNQVVVELDFKMQLDGTFEIDIDIIDTTKNISIKSDKVKCYTQSNLI